MFWNWIALLAGAASVSAHATHHVEDQDPLSQERLDELEKKWGTDVRITSIAVRGELTSS